MHRFKLLVVFVSLALLGAGIVPGGLASAGAESREIRWLTYTDPHFGFSVEYPADWEVIPRQDFPGHVGGSVIFSQTGDCAVECGQP